MIRKCSRCGRPEPSTTGVDPTCARGGYCDWRGDPHDVEAELRKAVAGLGSGPHAVSNFVEALDARIDERARTLLGSLLAQIIREHPVAKGMLAGEALIAAETFMQNARDVLKPGEEPPSSLRGSVGSSGKVPETAAGFTGSAVDFGRVRVVVGAGGGGGSGATGSTDSTSVEGNIEDVREQARLLAIEKVEYGTWPGYQTDDWIMRARRLLARLAEDGRSIALPSAVARAGFRVAPDLLGSLTLWCIKCGRDSGFHHATCPKGAAPRHEDCDHSHVETWYLNPQGSTKGPLVLCLKCGASRVGDGVGFGPWRLPSYAEAAPPRDPSGLLAKARARAISERRVEPFVDLVKRLRAHAAGDSDIAHLCSTAADGIEELVAMWPSESNPARDHNLAALYEIGEMLDMPAESDPPRIAVPRAVRERLSRGGELVAAGRAIHAAAAEVLAGRGDWGVSPCALCGGLKVLPNFMDAPDHPRCACGRPSRRESGECEVDHGPVQCPRCGDQSKMALTIPRDPGYIKCACKAHDLVGGKSVQFGQQFHGVSGCGGSGGVGGL